MKLRECLYGLDNELILESDEVVLDTNGLFNEIQNLLDHMSDDEVDEFGAFLAVEFFDTPEEDIEEVYFDINNVVEMIKELGEESYGFILELLLPDDFEASDDSGYTEVEYNLDDLKDSDDSDELEEAVGRVLKTTNINRKKRKFFKKSAAVLRREKAARMKQNRLTKASRKAYRRVNAAKLKAYQKSRKTFIKKGAHKVKIRRKAGGVA